MGVIGVNIEGSCSAMFEHGQMLIVKPDTMSSYD
jgi:hypothetical protein